MIHLSLALCFSALSLLCLAMDRHHEQVFARRTRFRHRRYLRASGGLLLVASILPGAQTLGWSVGIGLWLGAFPVAAILLVLLLAYRPQLVMPLAGLLPLSTFVWFLT